MAQTKVGEAYVEIHPRLAKDFSKRLRDELEKKLAPVTRDLGRNIGASLGDSVGESFGERFGDHALQVFDDIDLDRAGEDLGERAGNAFGDGFRYRAGVGIEEYGREMETTISRHLVNVSQASERTGRDIDLNLGSRLANALTSTGGLASNLAKLATSAVTASGTLATMAGGAAVAVQGALALAAALAPAVGALAAVPGGIALAVASFGTLKLALNGVGDAFAAAISGDMEKFLEATANLAPAASEVAYELFQMSGAFQGIRLNVQDALFAPLVGEMWSLNDVLTVINNGMVAVAGSFGRAARELLEFVRSGETLWAIESIFISLRESIDAMGPALRPLLVGFRDLAVVSAAWIAGLVPGLADATAHFGNFMRNAAASGQALEWMNNALEVFKQLGSLIGDVVGIVRALFHAIETQGGSALGILGSLVGGLRDFLESAQGQQILISIFDAIGRVGAALLPVLQALAGAVALLAPILADLAELIGPILTTAINALAPALSVIGGALVTVFTQLGSAVTILAESGALEAIATALAEILVAVSPLLPLLAQLIGLLANQLASIIIQFVVPALKTLVGWLTDAARWLSGAELSEDTWLARVVNHIYNTVAPLFEQAGEIIERVFNDLVRWFQENRETVEQWGVKIEEIITQVGDVVSGIFEFIAWAWDKFGGPLLDIVGNTFTGILNVVSSVLTTIQGVIDFIMGVITGDWDRAWNGIKKIFEGIWNALVSIVETIFNNMKRQIQVAVEAIGIDWESSWNLISDTFQRIWNHIVDWITNRVEDVKSVFYWFQSLPSLFSEWFGNVLDNVQYWVGLIVNWLGGLPRRIQEVFDGAINWLFNAGRAIVEGLWNGIVSLWNWVVENWNNMVNTLINIVKSILGIASPSRVMREMGRFLVEGLVDGIRVRTAMLREAVTVLAETAVDAWGTPEFPAPAFDSGSAVRRLPATTQPARSQDLTQGGGVTKVYDITLEAVPTIPTERQLINALHDADALYA